MTQVDSSTPPRVDRGRKFFEGTRRVAGTLCRWTLFFLALLSFPSVLPWMTAGWLVWCSWLVARGRPGYQPLFACLIVLGIHLVVPTPWMLLFLGTTLTVAVVGWRRSRRECSTLDVADRESPKAQPTQVMSPPNVRPSLGWGAVLLLWITWGLMVREYRSIENASEPRPLKAGAPVVCIGDSLTQGLLPDRGYPEQLKEMIDRPVINLGFSGIATSQGLAQMDRVLAHQPQVVVIELGGHDFLKMHSRSSTKRNLTAMIEACRDGGSDVVLLEIPRGFMVDPYACVERQIAYEQDVQLVSDTWLRQIVLMSPVAPPGRWLPYMHLSDDGIHSNERGSRAIAGRVREALVRMYGERILNQQDR